MVGSIDPRCETIRGTHWPVKVAGVFGARVAENHLGQRSTDRINRPDIWMQAIRSDLEKLLRHGGRPHMGPGVGRDDERVSSPLSWDEFERLRMLRLVVAMRGQIPRYAACTCLLFASSALLPCMMTLPLSST